jgi:hypothetical protein
VYGKYGKRQWRVGSDEWREKRRAKMGEGSGPPPLTPRRASEWRRVEPETCGPSQEALWVEEWGALFGSRPQFQGVPK